MYIYINCGGNDNLRKCRKAAPSAIKNIYICMIIYIITLYIYKLIIYTHMKRSSDGAISNKLQPSTPPPLVAKACRSHP